MPSYVVFGASRGIGLEFVRQLAREPSSIVFALIRDVSKVRELQDIAHANENVHIVQADLEDLASIKSAVEIVSKATDGELDYLINNAARMAHERGVKTIDAFPDEKTLENDFLDFFKTNVIGTTHSINAFMKLLQNAKKKNSEATPKVVALTSTLGSVKLVKKANDAIATNVAYSVSKAALNMVIAKFAARFTKEGIAFVAVNPGLVKTFQAPKERVDALFASLVQSTRTQDATFPDAINTDKAVEELIVFIHNVGLKESGLVLNRNGSDAFETWE